MDLPPYHPFRSARAKARYLAAYDVRAARWPVPCRDAWIDTSFGRTYARVSGSDDAPPLVLLPGIGATSLMWSLVVADLSQRHRVIAVDSIFDHGRSVWSRPLRSAADYVRWLDDLFDGLGLPGGIDLVAASYGGWMAAEYALQRPERLRRLVLIAPVGAVLRLGPAFMARAMLAQVPTRACFRQFMAWLAADLARGDAADREIFEEMVDDGYTAMRWFKPRRPVYPRRLADREWAALAVPTLFLVGADDRLFPPARAIERLHRVAPGIRTDVVPGAGHDMFATKPGDVSARILRFLEPFP